MTWAEASSAGCKCSPEVSCSDVPFTCTGRGGHRSMGEAGLAADRESIPPFAACMGLQQKLALGWMWWQGWWAGKTCYLWLYLQLSPPTLVS